MTINPPAAQPPVRDSPNAGLSWRTAQRLIRLSHLHPERRGRFLRLTDRDFTLCREILSLHPERRDAFSLRRAAETSAARRETPAI